MLFDRTKVKALISELRVRAEPDETQVFTPPEGLDLQSGERDPWWQK